MRSSSEAEARQRRIASVGFPYDAVTKHSIRACNLCGDTRLTTITHRDRYGFPARADRCETCGLVFLNPVMGRAEYADFYARFYRPLVSAYHDRLIDARSVAEEQVGYTESIGEFLSRHCDRGGIDSIADIGGSTGVVAKIFADRFRAKATVVDPAPLETREAERLGLETVTTFAEDWKATPGGFELVLLCQTIDHLLDVSGTLEKIHLALARNGRLFVDIVDFRAAYVREESLEAATKIDHPFYLTEATTEPHLERRGLAIIAKEYAPDGLHVRYVCKKSAPRPDALPEPTVLEYLASEQRHIHARAVRST